MRQSVLATPAFVAAFVLAVSLEPTASAQSATPEGKKTGYAPVNGIKMYYEIAGRGKPAVYIHPVVSHSGLVPKLTGNRRWIAVDLQGHGRTADVSRPMTCEQHADDVAALLKHLKIEEADFFGDSFGGAVAMMMTVRHPTLVRRVVIYGSPLVPFPKDVAATVTSDSDIVRWEREEYQKVAPDPTHWPTLFDKAMRSGAEWKGFSRDELKTVKAPVLIACGDRDLVPIERCVELMRMIPHAQLAVIPDASHFVLFSEPEKLLPTIAEFLDAPATRAPLGSFRTGYYPGMTR